MQSDAEPETLSTRVERLFGSAPRSIVRAAARHLDKRPGALDIYHLEVIAAAAPVIGDPKLVAELIDSMPVTGMHVATDEIDIRSWRNRFREVLPHYPTVTRTKLVKDLVDKSMLHVLSNVPTDRLTPVGEATYLEAMKRDLRGPAFALVRVANAPHMTRGLLVDVLDEVERRIERSEKGTSSRPARAMPIDAVGGALVAVLRQVNEISTDKEVVRAWKLVLRCEMTQQWRRYLTNVVLNNRGLPKDIHPTLLDQINLLEDIEDRQDGLCGILHHRELDEREARRAVELGAVPSQRLPLNTGRLALLRYHAYQTDADEGTLLPANLSDDEIDRRLARKPNRIVDHLIDEMTTQSVLQELCRREDELELPAFSALVRHPALDLATAIEAIARRKERAPRESMKADPYESVSENFRTAAFALQDDREMPVYEYCLMLHPGIDAVTARTLIDEARLQQLAYLLKGVLHNVSVNSNVELEQMVLDVLKQQLEAHTRPGDVGENNGHQALSDRDVANLLRHLACNSSSSSIHSQLVELALSTSNIHLALDLANNDMVRREVLSPTWALFVERGTSGALAHFPYWRTGHSRGWPHHPSELVREILDDPADRFMITRLIEECVEGAEGSLPEHLYATEDERREAFHAAVGQLIDNDLLTRDEWAKLVGARDEHTAHRYITHPKCPSNAVRFVSRAERELKGTVDAMDRGLGELPARDRSVVWSDLPNPTDEGLPRTELSDVIDGQVIAGLTMRTPRTERELRDVAERMGNCIAGFVDGVRAGTHVVSYADGEQRSYAALWSVTRGRKLRLCELNTSFNTNDVPVELRDGVARLTSDVNERRITRVAAVPVVNGPHRAAHVVRRPPARTAKVALHQDVQQTDCSETRGMPDSPSTPATNADTVARHGDVDELATVEVHVAEPPTSASAGHEGIDI